MFRMELVCEPSREGVTLWRAEIRDDDGRLIDSSHPTPHPRAAISDGRDLLRAQSDLPDYLPAWRQAQRKFTHAA